MPAKPRRRWWRALLILGAVFLGFLLWLNGPGIRWLLPKIASHFLQKQQIVAQFEVKGSVAGGLSIHNLDLVGGPVVTLKITELRPDYHWRELIEGKVRGIVVHEIEADIDLTRKFAGAAPPKEPSKPFDLAELIKTIRQQREKVLAYGVDITTKNITIREDEKLIAAVAPSALRHRAGDANFTLAVGQITMSDDRRFPEQENTIVWSEEQITLDQLGLSNELSVHDLLLTTPEDFRASFSCDIDVLDTTFAIQGSPDFERVSLQLREGSLDFSKLATWLGKDTPVTGRLQSLDLLLLPHNLPIHGATTEPMRADASVKMQLEDLRYEKHLVSSCTIELAKKAAEATLTVDALTMGAAPRLSIQHRWDQDPSTREEAKRFTSEFELAVPALQPLLSALRPLLGMEQKAPMPPASSLLVKGSCRMDGNKIGPLQADLTLRPDDASQPTIFLTSRSSDLTTLSAECRTEGLTFSADYNRETKSYDGRAELTEFDPHRLSPWLDWASITIPTGMRGTVAWQGKGDLTEAQHQGTAQIKTFSWKREAAEELLVDGQAEYQWPATADVRELRVKMGSQEARFDAQFAKQRLSISRLSLVDAGKSLISGTASIPVPEKMAAAADFLTQKEAITIDLQTEILPLNTFDRWLPKESPLPVKGTAKLDLQVTGSPAEPLISGDLAIKEVKSLSREDLPALDLLVNLATVKQQLQLTGQLLSSRTAPVSLSARMPFRPGAWVDEPDTVREEEITADVTIPRWDLSRFKDLVPQLKELAGELDGAITVKGKLGAPDIRGRLDLKKLQLTIPNEKVPPIRDASMKLTFADRTATLSSLRAQLAGGEFQASGTMKLPATGQPVLDFSLKGTALPLWRDAAVIARANADIRVAGPWDAVKISGPVRIVDSLLYKDFEIIPIGKPFTLPQAASLPALDSKIDAKAAAMPAPFGNWALDVSLQTQDPFLIRGNLARGSITVDVKVGGTLGNPQPLGKAIIQDLTAALPLSKLTISSGTVSLTPAGGMDPQLDIRGTSRVSNYDVNIYVYGAVSAPKLLLTSEPPLPENEIMTLLATGTTTAGLTDAATAQSKGTQLLIEEFRRGRLPMGRRLLPLLSKVENVEIAVGEPDPYSGKKRASAKMPVFSNYFLYGAVDGEGKTRSLFMFEWKFR